jgi:hypothetical protein
MKIDYDYMNEIFKIFLEAESPTVDWMSFETLRNGDDDKFIFHIQIMAEKGLISNYRGNSSYEDLGFKRVLSGNVHVNVLPWRLTANGHDFASTMNKADVLSDIKEKFKDEGLSVVIDVAKQIANKKAKELLGLPE